MLDIRLIEKTPEYIVEKLSHRQVPNVENLVATLLQKNQARKKTQEKADALANRLKEQSKQVASCFQQGKTTQAEALKATILADKETYKQLLAKLKQYEEEVNELLVTLPNLPADNVPIGRDASDNKIVKTWSPPVTPKGPLKPHWTLATQYHLVDFEQGNKIAGAGFPVYIGKGAKLQRALVHFFLDQAEKRNYIEHAVPLMVNPESAFGTGQLPDKEGMMYALPEKKHYLIPTAEVPLTNLYRNTILEQAKLPIKMVAHTPCFRREAGSWGRHVRGLNRLHQFDKVEIVQIVTPPQANAALEEMCHHVGQLLEALQLPYRVLCLSTADLGFTAAITYDFEVWSAGQQQWLEVSSVSCFDTYQARRMALRYKMNRKNHYGVTLNGSALALPRVLGALLENNQTKQGITIPEVLHPYTHFSLIA